MAQLMPKLETIRIDRFEPQEGENVYKYLERTAEYYSEIMDIYERARRHSQALVALDQSRKLEKPDYSHLKPEEVVTIEAINAKREAQHTEMIASYAGYLHALQVIGARLRQRRNVEMDRHGIDCTESVSDGSSFEGEYDSDGELIDGYDEGLGSEYDSEFDDGEEEGEGKEGGFLDDSDDSESGVGVEESSVRQRVLATPGLSVFADKSRSGADHLRGTWMKQIPDSPIAQPDSALTTRPATTETKKTTDPWEAHRTYYKAMEERKKRPAPDFLHYIDPAIKRQKTAAEGFGSLVGLGVLPKELEDRRNDAVQLRDQQSKDYEEMVKKWYGSARVVKNADGQVNVGPEEQIELGPSDPSILVPPPAAAAAAADTNDRNLGVPMKPEQVPNLKPSWLGTAQVPAVPQSVIDFAKSANTTTSVFRVPYSPPTTPKTGSLFI